MIRLGEEQAFVVSRLTDFGVYLKKESGEDEVLLPKSQVPKGTRVGDALAAFVYKDSEDRPIATRITPLLALGEVAKLSVSQCNEVGAFLSWGLPKDLLLPFAEQTRRVEEGDEVLVALYVDNSERLCATMKVYPYLSLESPYRMDDRVRGTVYDVIEDFGAYVAVDDRYSAMIPKKELIRKPKVGSEIEARVIAVKEDGKLDLSLRDKSYLEMDSDAEMILARLKKAGGFLPFHDKSESDAIRAEFEISKGAFKRAIGRLYKERKIEIAGDGIRLVGDE